MIATILDTLTGKKEIKSGVKSWEWAENNWSCDCNRNIFDDEDGVEDHSCKTERFLVVEAIMDSEEDYEYTLEELNADYPIELLRKHNLI